MSLRLSLPYMKSLLPPPTSPLLSPALLLSTSHPATAGHLHSNSRCCKSGIWRFHPACNGENYSRTHSQNTLNSEGGFAGAIIWFDLKVVDRFKTKSRKANLHFLCSYTVQTLWSSIKHFPSCRRYPLHSHDPVTPLQVRTSRRTIARNIVAVIMSQYFPCLLLLSFTSKVTSVCVVRVLVTCFHHRRIRVY